MNIKEFKKALKNKRRILAERFGTSPEFWLELQMNYDIATMKNH